MTYILRTTRGEFEHTRTYATAIDAVSALDTSDASPVSIVSIDKMGSSITEAELRHDAEHEGARESLHLPDVSTP